MAEDGAEARVEPSRLDGEDHSIRRPDIAREMTSCWISLVPSKIVWITFIRILGAAACCGVPLTRGSGKRLSVTCCSVHPRPGMARANSVAPEVRSTGDRQHRRHIASVGSLGLDPGPASPVVLTWPTFRPDAADAGISRLYDDFHFQNGDRFGPTRGDRRRAVRGRPKLRWPIVVAPSGGAH